VEFRHATCNNNNKISTPKGTNTCLRDYFKGIKTWITSQVLIIEGRGLTSYLVAQTHLDMLHDPGKVHWFVLPLHHGWVQPVPTVLELNYELLRVPNSTIVL
jgi:hypothetical protein